MRKVEALIWSNYGCIQVDGGRHLQMEIPSNLCPLIDGELRICHLEGKGCGTGLAAPRILGDWPD